MDKKLQARIILEVLGRPPEYITEALKLLITKLRTEKSVAVLEQILHEPSLIKDSQTLYTSFADITLEFENLEAYFDIIFSYMPSHVELIFPEKIEFTNDQFNHIANRLVQRLHNYDAIAKGVLAERNVMLEKIKEVAPDFLRTHPLFATSTSQKQPLPRDSQKPQRKSKQQVSSQKKRATNLKRA